MKIESFYAARGRNVLNARTEQSTTRMRYRLTHDIVLSRRSSLINGPRQRAGVTRASHSRGWWHSHSPDTQWPARKGRERVADSAKAAGAELRKLTKTITDQVVPQCPPDVPLLVPTELWQPKSAGRRAGWISAVRPLSLGKVKSRQGVDIERGSHRRAVRWFTSQHPEGCHFPEGCYRGDTLPEVANTDRSAGCTPVHVRLRLFSTDL